VVGVPGANLLGLTLFFDSNQIGSGSAAVRFLAHLHREGCIAVVLSDAVDNELANAPHEKYEKLTEDAAQFRRAFGVVVPGHSRWGSSVWGSEADSALMDELRAIVRPGIDDWATARRQHTRDVMHLHTAIRYGADAFVTEDDHILKKADALRAHINVWTPRRAARVGAQAVAQRPNPEGPIHDLTRFRSSKSRSPARAWARVRRAVSSSRRAWVSRFLSTTCRWNSHPSRIAAASPRP
jgi:hypothetical protein